MPIKFACPQCKNLLTVDEKMAGKSGKCKCGAAIRVPSLKAKPAAPEVTPETASPSASAFGAGFDDLTEADYNRFPAGHKVHVARESTESKLESMPGSGLRPQSAKAKKRGRRIGLWQWGLIVIFASIIANVVIMQVQGPMQDTAASRGQALGRGVATGLGIVIGVALIIVHFVRRKRK